MACHQPNEKAIEKAIVIDASVIIHLGYVRTSQLIIHLNEHVDLCVTQKSISEVREYFIEKRSKRINDFLNEICSTVTIVKDHELEPFEAKARALISHDPDDWQEVALALKLSCAILTEDTDFFGIGIVTWKSDAIYHLLEHFKN